VRNLTSRPATAWKFAESEGLVREGFVADLNVIDPIGWRPGCPEVVSDLPGGAKRLVQGSVGSPLDHRRWRGSARQRQAHARA